MATFAQSHSKHSNDPSGSSDTGVSLSPYKMAAALTAGLLLLALTPRVQSNATLAYSVIGAALALGAWQIFQILTARWSARLWFQAGCAPAALHSDDGAVQCLSLLGILLETGLRSSLATGGAGTVCLQL